jgi:hypothetical protein
VTAKPTKPDRGLSGLERVKRTAKLLRAKIARLSMRPDNRVGAVIDYSEGPYPFRFRRLIVTAPGFIDTVDEEDEEDDLFGDDETASRSDTKAPPAPATDWTSLQRLLLEKTIQPPRTGHNKQDEQ